jgi:hypothetical protein
VEDRSGRIIWTKKSKIEKEGKLIVGEGQCWADAVEREAVENERGRGGAALLFNNLKWTDPKIYAQVLSLNHLIITLVHIAII